MKARELLRWSASISGLTAFGAFALLFGYAPAAYFQALSLLGVHPGSVPFVDAQHIVAAIDCSRRGLDVYAADPCDIYGRAFAYSPLWLLAPVGPIDTATTYWCGCGLGILFLLSLGGLPCPRDRRDAAVMIAATLSTASFYAVERGNIDQLVFLIVLAFTWLAAGTWPYRAFGYGAVIFAGLLKFYPLVLLLVSLRERPRGLILVNAAGLGVVGLVFWLLLPQLAEMARNIPTGTYFGVFFGAVNLPRGLAALIIGTESEHAAAAYWAATTVLCGLALLAGGWAVAIGRREDFRVGLAAMVERERLCLVVGAALIVGCFFAGQSVWYRAIFLLLTMSGFLALGHAMTHRAGRRLCGAAVLVQLFLLWQELFRSAIFSGLYLPGWPGLLAGASLTAFWVMRELTWWWLIAVLGGVLVGFTLASPVWRSLPAIRGGAMARV